jgi:hypothetical protein
MASLNLLLDGESTPLENPISRISEITLLKVKLQLVSSIKND